MARDDYVGYCRACQVWVKNWKRHMVSKKHRECARRARWLDRKYRQKSLESVLERENGKDNI